MRGEIAAPERMLRLEVRNRSIQENGEEIERVPMLHHIPAWSRMRGKTR
jgi:hypothetical protein